VFGTDYDTADGTCIRDYIHVNELASAHRLAVESLCCHSRGGGNRADRDARSATFSGAINLGTGKGTSVKEIIQSAEKVSGKTCRINYAPRRDGDPAKLVAANTKAREILGWSPARNIEEIIASAWHWETNRKY